MRCSWWRATSSRAQLAEVLTGRPNGGSCQSEVVGQQGEGKGGVGGGVKEKIIELRAGADSV